MSTWDDLPNDYPHAVGIIRGLRAEIERLRMKDARLKAIVAEQAEDHSLWFMVRFISENHLQHALRRLHAEIEGKSPEQCAVEVLTGKPT